MSWKGMPGAVFIGNSTVDQVIEKISAMTGANKSKVLIGARKEPPDIETCVVYAECSNSGAVIWKRERLSPDGEWYNWSYTDMH